MISHLLQQEKSNKLGGIQNKQVDQRTDGCLYHLSQRKTYFLRHNTCHYNMLKWNEMKYDGDAFMMLKGCAKMLWNRLNKTFIRMFSASH